MKLNDVKHNHSLTDLLKILIFSILMMIPFIDVGVRCAYVVVNKNAYQSYSALNSETNYVDVDTLNSGYNYSFLGNDIITNDSYYESQNYLIVDNAKINNVEYGNIKIGFYAPVNTQVYMYLRNLDDTQINFGSVGSYNGEFTLLNYVLTDNLKSLLIPSFKLTNNDNSLDNVFDYSVNKLTTSELYTWTQQTAIYTGVQTMCTHLGINNTVIPLLLVYWFILTIIYIIIDIVLKLFTMLTHAIGSKTA